MWPTENILRFGEMVVYGMWHLQQESRHKSQNRRDYRLQQEHQLFNLGSTLKIAVAEDGLGSDTTGVKATAGRSDDPLIDQQINVMADELC